MAAKKKKSTKKKERKARVVKTVESAASDLCKVVEELTDQVDALFFCTVEDLPRGMKAAGKAAVRANKVREKLAEQLERARMKREAISDES